MPKKIKFVLVILILVFVLSGCYVRKFYDDFVVRMSMEQIKDGAFTGGRLIHSEDKTINLLEKGLLIPITNITKGWIQKDSGDEYEFGIIEKNYGYYYIVDIDSEKIILDYLLYDEFGKIIHHEENLVISDGAIKSRYPNAANNIMREYHHSMSYSKLNTREMINSRSFNNASFLSFPNETPTEEEMKFFDKDKVYKTTVFRLQETNGDLYKYDSGVIIAHETEPVLVFNSSYFDKMISDTDNIKVMDDEKPDIAIGDYILDGETSVARKIIGKAGASDDGFEMFIIEDTPIQDVLGMLEINVSGDLGEIIYKYGTQEQRDLLKSFAKKRGLYDLISEEGTASLWDEGPAKMELDYRFYLGANIDLHSSSSWDQVSASGKFSFNYDANYDLIFKLLSADPGTNEKGKFISVPVKGAIDLGPVTLKAGLTFNLIGLYESNGADTALEFGVLSSIGDTEIGLTYDVGAKLNFIWGFIPVPQLWCDVHEIYSPGKIDIDFIYPQKEELFSFDAGLGIGLGVDLNLFNAVKLSFDTGGMCKLKFGESLKDDWWIDVGYNIQAENVKFSIGIPMTSIGYTWDFGKVVDRNEHLFSIKIP